jgi:hypothetical protein
MAVYFFYFYKILTAFNKYVIEEKAALMFQPSHSNL